MQARTRRASRVPVATILVTAVTAAGAVAQVSDSSVLSEARRNYHRLHEGQWWRVVSPLFVQSAGWGQILFNLGSMVVVGVLAERRLGALRWLGLYFGVGLAGEALAYWLEPNGSGNSFAVCALVGALGVYLIGRPSTASRVEIFVVPYYTACVAGLAFGGAIGATVMPAVALGVLISVVRRPELPAHAAVWAGGLSFVTAAAMSLKPDEHGISLLAGGVVTALAWAAFRRRGASSPVAASA